jgi:hypothetical protein
VIARARRAAVAALLALAAGAALAQGEGLPPADWREIRGVVEKQRAALVAGEAERAFAYASRAIREQFGDAETFMAMVRRSYAALIDASDAVLLEGAVIDGQVIQPLRLVLPDNTVLVALYPMVKERGAWRTNGCVLAPSTLRAT